jgi:pilus assembly protein CpaC
MAPILQATETDAGVTSGIGPELGSNSTAFGIFPTARMDIILRALRQNAVLRILAEPNLVSLSGHEASFLAGGEFPVPVAQGGAFGAGNISVQYKQFGVQLNFVPYIQDDDVIRLEVRPEVSSIDNSLGTTLVVGGEPTPGINTRRVHTTVQMREGETLALAGLLQVELEANTNRVPGLGDLPYIGPLFSNTSHNKQEKELLVLVTPFLVSPMNACDVPALPGAEIQDPNDLEFYFLNRIEGRTGRPFRSTMSWEDPWHMIRKLKLERDHACGPVGFSSFPNALPDSR